MATTGNSEALRAYLQMASGLTEVTAAKARAAARSVVDALGPDAAAAGAPLGRQAQAVADELIAAARANREQVSGFVRTEVDRALDALGLARREEVTALKEQVERLTESLRATEKPARTTRSTAAGRAKESGSGPPAGGKAGARRTPRTKSSGQGTDA